VAVSRTLALDRVTTLKEDITGAIKRDMPEAEVIITTQPRALDNETIPDRVMVIARNRGLAVHHVTVQDIGGRLAVSLDLEVDGHLALSQAHEIASALETAIRDELGPQVEVETHIEPLQAHGLDGRDAAPERAAAIAAALTELAAGLGPIRGVHDVRVRETPDGEIVNFHCLIDPTLSVHEVHDKVDELEQALRRKWRTIERVIGHAEPQR
jgi:divalent metal cation (Fe/Co/Zn/Cd) transporter